LPCVEHVLFSASQSHHTRLRKPLSFHNPIINYAFFWIMGYILLSK
jgi:hypothetical protein